MLEPICFAIREPLLDCSASLLSARGVSKRTFWPCGLAAATFAVLANFQEQRLRLTRSIPSPWEWSITLRLGGLCAGGRAWFRPRSAHGHWRANYPLIESLCRYRLWCTRSRFDAVARIGQAAWEKISPGCCAGRPSPSKEELSITNVVRALSSASSPNRRSSAFTFSALLFRFARSFPSVTPFLVFCVSLPPVISSESADLRGPHE